MQLVLLYLKYNWSALGFIIQAFKSIEKTGFKQINIQCCTDALLANRLNREINCLPQLIVYSNILFLRNNLLAEELS